MPIAIIIIVIVTPLAMVLLSHSALHITNDKNE